MSEVISLREAKDEEVLLALSAGLLLKMVLAANETGLLHGEIEDVILAQQSSGEWGYRFVNKNFGRS